VRLVVRRVGVLAVPAAGEVNLGPNSTRTLLRRELVVPRGLSVEVETKERHGLLSEAAGIVGAEGCVSTDHPEIIRERSRRSWLIIEEVVNDSSSGEGFYPLGWESRYTRSHGGLWWWCRSGSYFLQERSERARKCRLG
jgi:hypothetical protein